MAAIWFLKLDQNYSETSFPSRTHFFSNMMKLASIFKLLEDVYDFQTIAYSSHFVLQNEGKNIFRHIFIVINILCIFGKDI